MIAALCFPGLPRAIKLQGDHDAESMPSHAAQLDADVAIAAQTLAHDYQADLALPKSITAGDSSQTELAQTNVQMYYSPPVDEFWELV